jgi:serine/threonine-protein kinase
VWNQNISAAALDPASSSMIAALETLGGFGGLNFQRMQIDFSLIVVHAPPDSPMRTIVTHPDGYYSPDCDALGTTMPVPLNAAIEGHGDLDCDNEADDCHLLVVQGSTLYEAYAAKGVGDNQLESLCLAVWQLDAEYPPQGRGEHCTSADAAGFPMAPLMFNADDIAAALALDASGGGDLGHAIRFTIRNERMASDGSLGGVGGRLYVRPASHAGSPSGPSTSIPYGAHLRLKAGFPLTGYSPAARVLLNTFKRYGIVLADGGNITLTAESDMFTTTKWLDLGIDSREFDLTAGAQKVNVTDFEVIDTGPRIGETWECVRTVLPPPTVFKNGFENPGP